MKTKYKKEVLEPIIKSVKSWRQVCLNLNIVPATGSQVYIKKVVTELGIDYSHFTGQAWNKGNHSTTRKDSLQYCYNGSTINSDRLKKYLIKDGHKKEECEICHLKEWNKEPIVLELDHIDSNHTNNEFNNLQVICSNCHAQLTRKRRMPK